MDSRWILLCFISRCTAFSAAEDQHHHDAALLARKPDCEKRELTRCTLDDERRTLMIHAECDSSNMPIKTARVSIPNSRAVGQREQFTLIDMKNKAKIANVMVARGLSKSLNLPSSEGETMIDVTVQQGNQEVRRVQCPVCQYEVIARCSWLVPNRESGQRPRQGNSLAPTADTLTVEKKVCPDSSPVIGVTFSAAPNVQYDLADLKVKIYDSEMLLDEVAKVIITTTTSAVKVELPAPDGATSVTLHTRGLHRECRTGPSDEVSISCCMQYEKKSLSTCIMMAVATRHSDGKSVLDRESHPVKDGIVKVSMGKFDIVTFYVKRENMKEEKRCVFGADKDPKGKKIVSALNSDTVPRKNVTVSYELNKKILNCNFKNNLKNVPLV